MIRSGREDINGTRGGDHWDKNKRNTRREVRGLTCTFKLYSSITVCAMALSPILNKALITSAQHVLGLISSHFLNIALLLLFSLDCS